MTGTAGGGRAVAVVDGAAVAAVVRAVAGLARAGVAARVGRGVAEPGAAGGAAGAADEGRVVAPVDRTVGDDDGVRAGMSQAEPPRCTDA